MASYRRENLYRTVGRLSVEPSVDVRCRWFGHDRYTTSTVDGDYVVYRCERCGQEVLRGDDEPPFDV